MLTLENITAQKNRDLDALEGLFAAPIGETLPGKIDRLRRFKEARRQIMHAFWDALHDLQKQG